MPWKVLSDDSNFQFFLLHCGIIFLLLKLVIYLFTVMFYEHFSYILSYLFRYHVPLISIVRISMSIGFTQIIGKWPIENIQNVFLAIFSSIFFINHIEHTQQLNITFTKSKFFSLFDFLLNILSRLFVIHQKIFNVPHIFLKWFN